MFPPPELSEDEIDQMRKLGREVCTQVAYASRRAETGSVSVRWKALGIEHGVELFLGEDPLPEDEKYLTYMCGVTDIYASIEEVADLFDSDTEFIGRNSREKMSYSMNQQFFQNFYEDMTEMQHLTTLRSRTEKYPRHSVSLKTFTLLSPSQLAQSRDFVFLEVRLLLFCNLCTTRYLHDIYSAKKISWMLSVINVDGYVPCIQLS